MAWLLEREVVVHLPNVDQACFCSYTNRKRHSGNDVELFSRQRRQHEMLIRVSDGNPHTRWRDDNSSLRTELAIYDLGNFENVRARAIADAFKNKNLAEAERLSARESAIEILNRILRLANLQVVLSIHEDDGIVATRNGGPRYSIAKLSDGERSAILVAANVLTAEAGTLFIMDEPERHLHRSIVSPLLSLLLKERPDCAFVVSTHEPLLPVDNPTSKVLLMRACTYDGDEVTSYDIDLLEQVDEIDDELKRTILGERRKIVFVEGLEHSLDKPLYSLLFPNVSVVAKSNCREVENAVVGIKGTAELHWVNPFGLVDNDSSGPERLADLQAKGLTALEVYSVESIYYHPAVQRMVGERHSEVVGGNLEENLAKANDDAIKAVRACKRHFTVRVAEKSARSQVFSLLPKKGEVADGGKRTVEIDFSEIFQLEESRLEAAINDSNFIEVLKRYPIRESHALDAIARALGFSNRNQYEAAVRKLLMDDSEAVKFVRELLGSLPVDLTE